MSSRQSVLLTKCLCATNRSIFSDLSFETASWDQFYKTIYGRNLQMFLINVVFFPGKPFQPSLMLATKAGEA